MAEPPRICFLVMSHTEPDLVERLVRTIVAELPDACVVVRHDARTVPFEAGRVTDLPHVHVRAHYDDARWGSWAFTQRQLEGVEHALDLEEPWEWLAVISGQSYPVAPLADMVEHLATTPSDAALRLATTRFAAAPSWWRRRPHGADRARYRFLRLPWTPLWEVDRVRRAVSVLADRQPLLAVFFHHDPQRARRSTAMVGWMTSPRILAGTTPVKASSWWAVRRATARSLLTLLDHRDPWNKHFRRTFTSDELAVPTYLAATERVVEDWSLHAISWQRGSASPDVLTAEHLPWLEGRPEPFTRKVSLGDGGRLAGALDELRARRAAHL